MAWTIRWLRDRVGRVTGQVETWGQEGSLKKWLAEGWIEIVEGNPAPKPATLPPRTEVPARGMGLRSFDRPPVDRSIRAPVKKGRKGRRGGR